jgi:hypothetical protein
MASEFSEAITDHWILDQMPYVYGLSCRNPLVLAGLKPRHSPPFPLESDCGRLNLQRFVLDDKSEAAFPGRG